jgi:hypothetical protein
LEQRERKSERILTQNLAGKKIGGKNILVPQNWSSCRNPDNKSQLWIAFQKKNFGTRFLDRAKFPERTQFEKGISERLPWSNPTKIILFNITVINLIDDSVSIARIKMTSS